MPDVSLGTINLQAFCGCPSECPDCCEVETDCCVDTVPTTLYATVSRAVPSACSDDITLEWSEADGWWEGSGTIRCGVGCVDSQAAQLRLICLPAGTWRLTTSCDDFVNSVDNAPSSASCNPLDLQFPAAMPGTGCATCPGGVLTVDVVE